MTTIYPLSRLAAGLHPKSGQPHRKALDDVISGLSAFGQYNYVLLAGGSTVRGQADAASDVDLLLIVDVPRDELQLISSPFFQEAVAQPYDIVERSRREAWVPIDFYIEAKGYCQDGLHTLGYGYVHSLREVLRSQDWTEEGLGFIRWPSEALRRDFASYVEGKIRKLHRGLICDRVDYDSEISCEVLADVIDAPFHALRRLREWKTLDCTDVTRFRLVELVDSYGWLDRSSIDCLELLIDLRADYVRLLEEGGDIDSCKQFLVELEMAGLRSLDVLRKLQLLQQVE